MTTIDEQVREIRRKHQVVAHYDKDGQYVMTIPLVEAAIREALLLRPGKVRIRCTDSLGNISYILKNEESVQGVLANGTPAALFYCGITGDEMAAKFQIGDAPTPEQTLNTVRALGSRSYKYEVV